MKNLRIYSVSDGYIEFLRSDPRLCNVFDNKEPPRHYTRKYLGVVLSQGGYNYYIPFSSPKKTDYIQLADGTSEIRKSILPIIRMVTSDTLSGEIELKGTLKLSNMIPVPMSELVPYDISAEKDLNYKQVVIKELNFIRHNEKKIIKSALVLYRQKTETARLFLSGNAPGYLKSVVDFKYAELKCREFERMREHAVDAPARSSVLRQLQDIKNDMDGRRTLRLGKEKIDRDPR